MEIRGTIDYNYYEGKVSYRKTITSVMLRTDKEEKEETVESAKEVEESVQNEEKDILL